MFDDSFYKDHFHYSVVSHYKWAFWDGNIPKPEGIVTLVASKTPHKKQVQKWEEIITLINDDLAPTLETLNQAYSSISFLVPVPDCTYNYRVLYDIGSDNRLTGLITNNLRDNILALYREIVPQVKIPNVIKFPEEAFFPHLCKVPTMAQIQLQYRKKVSQYIGSNTKKLAK